MNTVWVPGSAQEYFGGGGEKDGCWPFDANCLEKLAQPGWIGFYESCAVTSIICHSKKTGEYHNVFTLAVFEESLFDDYKLLFHTPKLLPVTRGLNLIIVSQRVKVVDAVNLYKSITAGEPWQQPDCAAALTTSVNELLPPYFVPVNGDVPVRRVLKNPHRYANYIVEFFSLDKPLLNRISPDTARGRVSSVERKIYDLIGKYLPVDLEYIRDRWENILFQFPVNLLKVEVRGDEDERHLWVGFRWHPKVENNPPVVSVRAVARIDGLVCGSGYWRGQGETCRLHMGTTDGEIQVEVAREDGATLLHDRRFALLKQIHIDGRIASPEPATVHVPEKRRGEPAYTYPVEFFSKSSGGIKRRKGWRQHVSARVNLASKRELVKRLEFKQYGVGGLNDRDKAMKDLRYLVGRHGEAGVYLWDPYADAIDILATLFACPVRLAPLRVITACSRMQRRAARMDGRDIKSYSDYVTLFKQCIKEGMRHRVANLEVRCQYGNHGWKFHDRFLIFPQEEGGPRVWALGASVNEIGRSHSILIKVEHGQPVLDAFEKLWAELESCVVWP